ncbi:hypothetical protein CONPUDRAFT_80778 [Coniophora puteana RWD-64-598 SS2]|uniref:Macrofage activating glyco protein n=1 Tax=Coniophora puteana (strain RWD-64-598) TaxID=741705 RepID=A0A5M3MZI4_CONPW|nr:uncharacterized protein CONPUDRAFT_80778 [Coniophora puteana RWD-64-598 SS2]EIW84436.1 hypothetical protein CONPUDRAFT_80778 [Coniophora puteana RWD-64-598 SS2]
MSRTALSTFLTLAIAARFALAQPDPADPTPLVDKTYSYPGGIPYQVDYNTAAIRGPQTGYNICNSTTENQESLCQTSFVNQIDDFCLWAPASPNSTIADTEQSEVAWCTKNGHGTRVIPPGALTGVQYLRTPNYVQIAGYLDQTKLDIAAGDYGGELDPHGADLRGNPLGGLMYSNVYPSSNTDNNTYTQIIDWNSFIGGNIFCIKICDPSSSSSDQTEYCQNIYDELGCSYNMPNNGQNGTFEVCDADNMYPVGIYTSGGQTLTYSQPYTGVVSPPYTATPPASSNCVQYASDALYSATASSSTSAGASPTGTSGSSGSGSSSGTSGTGSGSGSSGAASVGVSAAAGLAGVAFAMAIFA